MSTLFPEKGTAARRDLEEAGGVPRRERMLRRQMLQESVGDPSARNSRTGAAGLMQVMPATARKPGYGVRPMDWNMRFDAEENQRFGTDYMDAMMSRFGGDERRALAAYNWGPGRAARWSGRDEDLPSETDKYIENILGEGEIYGFASLKDAQDHFGHKHVGSIRPSAGARQRLLDASDPGADDDDITMRRRRGKRSVGNYLSSMQEARGFRFPQLREGSKY